MQRTTRWGLRYPDLSDDPDIPRDLANLAADLDGVAMDGSEGFPPVPRPDPRAGYYWTEGNVTYRGTGSTWVPVSTSPIRVRLRSPPTLTTTWVDVLTVSAPHATRGYVMLDVRVNGRGSVDLRIATDSDASPSTAPLPDPSGTAMPDFTASDPSRSLWGWRAWLDGFGWQVAPAQTEPVISAVVPMLVRAGGFPTYRVQARTLTSGAVDSGDVTLIVL